MENPLRFNVSETYELVAKPASAPLCGRCRPATKSECAAVVGLKRPPALSALPQELKDFFSDRKHRGVITAVELSDLMKISSKQIARAARELESARKFFSLFVFDVDDVVEVLEIVKKHQPAPRVPAKRLRRPPPSSPQSLHDSYVLLRIDEIDFSVRTANALDGENMRYVGELASHTREKLEARGITEKCLREIEQTLGAMGVKLGAELTEAQWGLLQQQRVRDSRAKAGLSNGVPAGNDGAAGPPPETEASEEA